MHDIRVWGLSIPRPRGRTVLQGPNNFNRLSLSLSLCLSLSLSLAHTRPYPTPERETTPNRYNIKARTDAGAEGGFGAGGDDDVWS